MCSLLRVNSHIVYIKKGHPLPLFSLFWIFSNKQCKFYNKLMWKCPSSIWCRDSNSQPSVMSLLRWPLGQGSRPCTSFTLVSHGNCFSPESPPTSIFLRFFASRTTTVNFPEFGTYRSEKQMSPNWKSETFGLKTFDHLPLLMSPIMWSRLRGVIQWHLLVFEPESSVTICWITSSPIFPKLVPKGIHNSFLLKSDVLKIAPKVTKYFGYFCKKITLQELQKNRPIWSLWLFLLGDLHHWDVPHMLFHASKSCCYQWRRHRVVLAKEYNNCSM